MKIPEENKALTLTGKLSVKIRIFFFSMNTMSVLVLGLIVSIIIATLLERIYGTSAAKVLVYNTGWFESLWIWFSVALFVNIIQFKLWQRKKWDVVSFPLAFGVILLGTILTKRFGIEGFLYLREGESSNQFFSSRPYLQIQASNGQFSLEKEYELWLSPVTKPFTKEFKIGKIPLSINIKRHIVNPEKDIVEDTEGGPVLGIATFTPHLSTSCFLEKGEADSLFGIHFGFGSGFREKATFIQLEDRGQEIWISSNSPMIRKQIDSGKKVKCKSGISMRFDDSSIYTLDSVSFALTRYTPKGRIRAIPSEAFLFSKEKSKTSEALDVIIESGSLQRSVSLFAGKRNGSKPKVIQCGGVKVELRFGPKLYYFPFSLRLVDFSIERYKNSQEPSQFISDVMIKDPKCNIEKPYSIYMNHILRYQGYRVYQYSFDKDEKGSIFFVSRDPGTPVAYAGFLLLIGTIALAFFHPKGRIRELETKIRKSKRSRSSIILLFLIGIICWGSSAFPQLNHSENEGALTSTRMINAITIPSEIVSHFTKQIRRNPETSLFPFPVQIKKLYRHFGIFERLGKWLVLIAFVFLLLSVLHFGLKDRFKKLFLVLENLFQWAIWLGFLVFTIGLGIRWVLATNVPWDIKYESMVLGAWASLLAGIALARHSRLPLICGSLLSGIVLIMAHTPAINSTISPLPPVLKSKWFILHVTIAMTSYGFFVVGTALAFVSLLALSSPISKKEIRFVHGVPTWSKITEQALWIGLLLLAIGSILGSIWANETWGQYWGWDPKESWTLIVILFYALVLHLRYVLRSHRRYWLNVWSFPAFGSLLMSYFGVNLFFSGMHSYGGGIGGQFPFMIFWIIGGWIVLSLLAYRNRKRI